MKARRLLAWGLLLALLVVAVGANRLKLLTAAGSFVVAKERPVHADAIVVLSGSIPDRILEAVDLYHEGWAPLIVLTEESARPGREVLQRRGASLPETHELNLSVAEQLGVPRTAIVVLDDRVNSTISEADVVLAHLRRIGARRALVVTSKMHSRRAALIFRARAPAGIEIVSCASRHDPYDPASWWRSRGYVRRLVFEYQKLAVFWLRDRWLSPAAHRPQAEVLRSARSAPALAGVGAAAGSRQSSPA